LVVTTGTKHAGPEQSPGSHKPASRKHGLGVGGSGGKPGFIGIDVSKARLDVALRRRDESFTVANNQRGIAALVKRLKKLCVRRIVLEASGGYEIAVACDLAAAGLPVAVVNPRQVRDFARANGSTGENRRDRCSSISAFCRNYSAANSTAAGCTNPRAHGTGRSAPAGG
jgi:Transposase